MKIIEKWGSGIPRLLRECREYGLSEPELIDYDGDFRVNMYRQELSEVRDNSTITQSATQIKMFVFTKEDKAILSLVQK